MGVQRKAIRFAGSIAASDSDTWSRTIQDNATLEKVIVHFPPGSEGDLRVTPYILDAQGQRFPVILVDDDGNVNTYLTGDTYTFDIPVSLPVKKGWTVNVDYDNQDAVNAHFVDIVFILDELGGLERVIV